jgi:hypothetical protein
VAASFITSTEARKFMQNHAHQQHCQQNHVTMCRHRLETQELLASTRSCTWHNDMHDCCRQHTGKHTMLSFALLGMHKVLQAPTPRSLQARVQSKRWCAAAVKPASGSDVAAPHTWYIHCILYNCDNSEHYIYNEAAPTAQATSFAHSALAAAASALELCLQFKQSLQLQAQLLLPPALLPRIWPATCLVWSPGCSPQRPSTPGMLCAHGRSLG